MLIALRPVARVGLVALLLCFVTSLAAANLAFAQKDAPSPSPTTGKSATDAAAATPQGRFIQNLGDHAIAILADKSLSTDDRSVQFRDMLRNSFDLMTIGRFVIGRSWNAATPVQQKEYMGLFEDLVVRTYSDRFALYTGEGFHVRSLHPEGEKDFVVNSEITHPDGSTPTTVDWRVRQRDNKLGIIDVVVEGVSMSVTQRQEYASIIQQNNGKIDGLLDLMRRRLQEPMPPHGQKG